MRRSMKTMSRQAAVVLADAFPGFLRRNPAALCRAMLAVYTSKMP
jgi:hypothetical protein